MGRGRVDFDRGIVRLSCYARYHGHANPKVTEVWLGWSVGLWVSNLRTKFRSGRLTDSQLSEAQRLGVRFAPPYHDPKPQRLTRIERIERDYLRRLESLESYFREHGDINIRQVRGTDDWPSAGRWIARLRCSYRKGSLTRAVVDKAEQLNICWNPGPGTTPGK